MDTNVIYLREDDDVISTCDQLGWTENQRALVVIPQSGSVLAGGLDLVRLLRFADRHRIEVGLVSDDRDFTRQALGLGIPVFTSVEAGLRSRRGWWRGRRRREHVGLPTRLGNWVGDRRSHIAPGISSAAFRPISARRWMLRFAGILLFFSAVALSYVVFAYTVPRATITLLPRTYALSATQQIIADPQASKVDHQRAKMPARLLEVDAGWTAEVETTGRVLVPAASSRGTVVFLNLTDSAVEIPAATRVSTEDGSIVFQTVVPMLLSDVISSTIEADVVALEPGPQGNVTEGALSRIVGALAAKVSVVNQSPTAGGNMRELKAVADADLDRVQSQARQFLQAIALAEMEARLTEREFLARDSLRVIEVQLEQYSHQPGEQTDTLRLKTEARLQGTAVDLTRAAGIIYEALAQRLPDGLQMVTGTMDYQQTDILSVDDDGRVAFLISGWASVASNLAYEEAFIRVAGQPTEIAQAFLFSELPLSQVPGIEVWPSWFDRVPFRPARIHAMVLSESS